MKRIRKIKNLILSHKKQTIIYSLFILTIIISAMTYAFAANTSVKSIIITSKNTSYENNEPGSWQLTKSAEWTNLGEATITLDVDTALLDSGNKKDIIFVLDISGSMIGSKLDRVKQDTKELLESLFLTEGNRAALITFESKSKIVSNLTSDKDTLLSQVDALAGIGGTNYYQALINVDNILKTYTKEENRDLVVLFLTDGYPNVDTPNQIAQYEYLKSKYPYITINGIQYEMGDTILDPIKQVSNSQYFADTKTLNNVLFEASLGPVPYDEFQIVDYIDNDYFDIENETDITVSEGEVKLEKENGKQKVTWTIPRFFSGRSAKLTIKVNLKKQYIGQGGIYPTNEREEITSQIENNRENVTSTQTPALSEGYHVIYDANAPSGCTPSNVPETQLYSVYDTISFAEAPSCSGYEFKGWEIATDGITKVNEDYFIMPESDVTIRAKWSKIELAKSMDGTVHEYGPPIMKSYSENTTEDYHNRSYKTKITSIVTKDNIDIPTTAIESWDVSQAGDGSVVAYIEDDGSGNGTYQLTLGGLGGIIANEDSSNLFGGNWNNRFSRLTSIDLSYLDTSNVTNMTYMFNYCDALEEIDLTSFKTTKVTNMTGMFTNCTGLHNVDLSSFYTPNLQVVTGMFYNANNLVVLDMSNFSFNSITASINMFMFQNGSPTIIVRDSSAKSFIEARLSEVSIFGVNVVIKS